MIEVFADTLCPFAHVGLRAVVRRRDRLGRHDVEVRVRAWPLELVNGAPLEAGATAEHAEALRAQVAPDLFAGLDPAHFPTTSLPSLALAAAAYRSGPEVGEAVSLALRRALFEDGRDISRPDVLAELGHAHGVGPPGSEDEEAVRRDWHLGERRGVRGSPHFFCAGAQAFCPSLDITRTDEGTLHVRRDTGALDAFLERCLSA